MQHSKNCYQNPDYSYMCDGKVECPVTKKEECGKALNEAYFKDGTHRTVTVFCFGCNKPHDV